MEHGDERAEKGWLLNDDNSQELPMAEITYAEARRTNYLIKTFVHEYVRVFYQLFLHAALLLALFALLVGWQKSDGLSGYPTFMPRPDSVRYHRSHEFNMNSGDPSPYAGHPTRENEVAWEELVTPSYLSLSQEEMVAASQDLEGSVEVAEAGKDGYLASLEVYHELHCIWKMRMFLYQDYYYPQGFSDSNMKYMRGHLDHCLEALRMASMCKGDTSVRSYFWRMQGEPVKPKTLAKTNGSRTCVQWDPLHTAMKSRALPYNPLLVMPDGSSSRVARP